MPRKLDPIDRCALELLEDLAARIRAGEAGVLDLRARDDAKACVLRVSWGAVIQASGARPPEPAAGPAVCPVCGSVTEQTNTATLCTACLWEGPPGT